MQSTTRIETLTTLDENTRGSSDRFGLQAAVRLYLDRPADQDQQALVCHGCPSTVHWQGWIAHRKRGGTIQSFDPQMERSANGAWNYFWARG